MKETLCTSLVLMVTARPKSTKKIVPLFFPAPHNRLAACQLKLMIKQFRGLFRFPIQKAGIFSQDLGSAKSWVQINTGVNSSKIIWVPLRQRGYGSGKKSVPVRRQCDTNESAPTWMLLDSDKFSTGTGISHKPVIYECVPTLRRLLIAAIQIRYSTDFQRKT